MKSYFALACLLLLVFATAVYATPVPPSGVQVISTSTRTITGSSNVSAQGGNVTELRIDALSVTKTWQGYYGNITGNIHLDDANNNSFYIWGNGTTLSGQIYATRNSSIDWTTVNCTNGTQRTAEETYLGVSANDGDSVTNTFNKTSHPSFNVGLRTITANSCFSTNVFVNGSAQNTTFNQILLSDNTTNIIYTTLIAYHTYGFNSNMIDFQLLVGENEHSGHEGPTPYYFFVELN